MSINPIALFDIIKRDGCNKIKGRGLAILPFFLLVLCTVLNADIMYLKNGQEVKGVIVEDYHDRVVLSAEKGESYYLKNQIEKIRYDTPEANLVKMGQIYKDKGEYKAALYYYRAAHKINPDMKEAQDGTILLTNLILQTREQDLEAQIAIKQDTEEKMGKVTGKKNLSVSLGIRAEELQRRLGISIRVIDSQVKVDKVFKKSVAYEAGIKKGDTIISVWGKLVRYMQLEDVYTLLLSGTINELKMVIARKAPLVLNEKRIFRGAEEMIGGRLRTKFRGLMVISILEAGPLKKAGIIEGDLLIKIGESPTRYMPLESAYKLIEETKKGLLNLEIQREFAIWKRG